MDDEPPLYPIVRDLNRLKDEIKDDLTAPKTIKNLIMAQEELKKREWDVNLEDNQLNSVQLDGFAKRLIAHLKKIREKAKKMEEELQIDALEEQEVEAP